MKKIAIILDSFSGRTKKEIEDLGFYFVPQSVVLDNKSFKDGVEIELKKDRQKILDAKDIKTSLPASGEVIELYEKLSKENDIVVFLTMPSGLSSTYSAAAALARDFKNVYVIDNKFCGTAIIEYAKQIKKDLEDGKKIEEVQKEVEEFSSDCFTVVMIKKVDSMIKSGRLRGLKRVILEKAKLLPVVNLLKDGFKSEALKRKFESSIQFGAELAIKFIGGIDKLAKWSCEIIHCGSEETNTLARSIFAKVGLKNLPEKWANTPIAAVAGTDAIGINIWRKPRS